MTFEEFYYWANTFGDGWTMLRWNLYMSENL